MDRQQLSNVEVHLTRVLNDSQGGRPFTLRVTDPDSGVLIAQCSLDETAFADLMSSSIAHCSGHVATTEQYARVGAKRTVVQEKVPAGITGGLYQTDGQERAAYDWAVERQFDLDADAVSVRRNRDGWQAVFSTWTRAEHDR